MRDFKIFLTDLSTHKLEGEPQPTSVSTFCFNSGQPIVDTGLVVASANVLLKTSAVVFVPQNDSIWGLQHAQVESIRKNPKINGTTGHLGIKMSRNKPAPIFMHRFRPDCNGISINFGGELLKIKWTDS